MLYLCYTYNYYIKLILEKSESYARRSIWRLTVETALLLFSFYMLII